MKAQAWMWLLAVGAMVGWACAVRPPHDPLGSPIEMAAEGPADNSFCFVCHANFKKETLAQTHRIGHVGCMDCHGFSDDHSADEDGVTPPEIMFPQERINPSCARCHNGYLTVTMTPPEVALKDTTKRYCTDCHGEHRLAVRTRRWDKVTGKLIYDDGVRMTRSNGMDME